MPYITKKTPSARTTDTALGKVMGYLAELLEYLKWENMCLTIDGIFPDIFPFGNVQGLLIEVCKTLYNRIYQESYNRGADKGNEINSQILGWLNDLKNDTINRVNEARAYISNNLINPIQNQINTYINPRIKEAQDKIAKIEGNINTAFSSLDTMNGKISDFDTQIKGFADQIETQRLKLNEIVDVANSTVSKLKDLENFIGQIDQRLKVVEGEKPTALPFKLPF